MYMGMEMQLIYGAKGKIQKEKWRGLGKNGGGGWWGFEGCSLV
jgi:hypothetical protein